MWTIKSKKSRGFDMHQGSAIIVKISRY